MVQTLGGTRSLVGVLGEQLGDEVLALLGNVVPYGVGEGEFADLNLLHNFLVSRSIEGRHTRKDDIDKDTTRPNVAFRTVILGQNFRSDVVRSTQLFVLALGLREGDGGAEVDDLDLVEFFVLFEQDVFRLQITMHDSIGVTVVDA